MNCYVALHANSRVPCTNQYSFPDEILSKIKHLNNYRNTRQREKHHGKHPTTTSIDNNNLEQQIQGTAALNDPGQRAALTPVDRTWENIEFERSRIKNR